MIKIENVEIFGWEAAIRGMRNAKESWAASDSYWTYIENPKTENRAKFEFFVGEADLKLMKNLAKAGSDHGKFMRMIHVSFDVTGPWYWLKEFDTYKVGTVSNSCSTMHRIHCRDLILEDFSYEKNLHLVDLLRAIESINADRKMFLLTQEKKYWYSMIQSLPSSYNQRRTVDLNYAVLRSMYHARKVHKLDEWRDFCRWIESLPYSELITDV